MSSCQSCLATGQICVVRGDDATLTIHFPDGTDLTEATVLFTAKRAPDEDPADSRAVLAETATLVDEDTVTVELDSTETRAVPAGEYLWDLKIIAEDGSVTHTRPGSICLHTPVTNRSA